MKELIVEILKIITPVSVALIVFAEGLGIGPGQVWSYFKEQPGRMLRSLIATLVLVPAAALAIILVLKPSPALSASRSLSHALRPPSCSILRLTWEEAAPHSWPACT